MSQRADVADPALCGLEGAFAPARIVTGLAHVPLG